MVNTGTYEYLIRKPTVDVLREYDLPAKISELAKRILVFHSAADVTLDIKHGKAIIELCRGPGSLIHLESANHLLTDNRNDCPFIAQTISSWLDRYLESTSK